MVEGAQKIGVIGAGTMGAGVAQAFAAAGYPVTLQDIAQKPLERGLATIAKTLERLAARGKLATADKEATLKRIKTMSKIDDLADCDVVLEAVVEQSTSRSPCWANSTGSAAPRRCRRSR